MICSSCPFNQTQESEVAQNLGCFPSPFEILEIKDDKNQNWACHSNPKKICSGLSEHRNTKSGKILIQPGVHTSIKTWEKSFYEPILLDNPLEFK